MGRPKNYKLTEETKRKIGLGNLGKIRSEEIRSKLRVQRHGRKLSLEHRKNISLGLKNHLVSEETKEKIGHANKGKIRSEEVRKNIRLSHLGLKRTEETKKKMSLARKGKKLSQDAKNKISLALKGTRRSIDFKKKQSILHKGKSNLKLKGKTWEEIYGLKRAAERKKQWHQNRLLWICPKYDTSIEIKIQHLLNSIGIKFIPHKYIGDIIHSYNCDIFIPKYNLIIECDGTYWHKYPYGTKIDKIRTKELFDNFYNIKRLWESDIKRMDENKLKYILDYYNLEEFVDKKVLLA